MTKEDIPEVVSRLLDNRPTQWINPIGDYDGRERTLEVLNVKAHERIVLRRKLRPILAELRRAANGPVIILFRRGKEENT